MSDTEASTLLAVDLTFSIIKISTTFLPYFYSYNNHLQDYATFIQLAKCCCALQILRPNFLENWSTPYTHSNKTGSRVWQNIPSKYVWIPTILQSYILIRYRLSGTVNREHPWKITREHRNPLGVCYCAKIPANLGQRHYHSKPDAPVVRRRNKLAGQRWSRAAISGTRTSSFIQFFICLSRQRDTRILPTRRVHARSRLPIKWSILNDVPCSLGLWVAGWNLLFTTTGERIQRAFTGINKTSRKRLSSNRDIERGNILLLTR